MSRYPRRFPARLLFAAAVLCLILALPAASPAGVVTIRGATYSLDGGKTVTGAWELAEQLAVAKDAAILVMGPQADPTAIQIMLQLLENLHVPTLLTKQADFKPLVERGVLHPTKTPAHP